MPFEEVDLRKLIKKKRENDSKFDELWKRSHKYDRNKVYEEIRDALIEAIVLKDNNLI